MGQLFTYYFRSYFCENRGLSQVVVRLILRLQPSGIVGFFYNGKVAVKLLTNLFNYNDGFQSTAIRQFTLDSTAMANANTAGEFVLTLDRVNSGDFIAFDYFELSGDIDPIPEPATMLLFGTGLVGLIGYNRKRFSKKN